MTLCLEICHPNEIIDGFWREVERHSTLPEAFEHIASPTFEWTLGTCLRVHDRAKSLYEGIYNHTECVDVGAKSAALKRYPWKYENLEFMIKDMDLCERWRMCPNASLMLVGIKDVVSKQVMARAVVACVRSTRAYLVETSTKVESLLEAIEAWSFDESKIWDIRKWDQEIAITNGNFQGVLRRVAFIDSSNYPKIAASIPEMFSPINQNGSETTQLLMSNAIRQHIPFYDIAVGYVV